MKRALVCSLCLLLIVPAGQNLALLRQRAFAQDDNETPSGGLEIAEVKGELESVTSNPPGLKVKSKSGESYVVVLARQATFEYSGTADVRFLQPGLFVRFVAPFIPQTLVPQAPITEIEVFREAKQRRMTREQMLSETPGIHPLQEQNNKPGKSAKPISAGPQNYQVVGQLRAVQDGKLQVLAGQFPVVAQLDPAASVKVASGDTFFCMPGDKVEVTGLRKPSQATLIQAEKVAITGTKTLGTPPEDQKETQKSRRSRLNRDKR